MLESDNFIKYTVENLEVIGSKIKINGTHKSSCSLTKQYDPTELLVVHMIYIQVFMDSLTGQHWFPGNNC